MFNIELKLIHIISFEEFNAEFNYETIHSISVTLFALTISFDSISLTFLQEI